MGQSSCRHEGNEEVDKAGKEGVDSHHAIDLQIQRPWRAQKNAIAKYITAKWDMRWADKVILPQIR